MIKGTTDTKTHMKLNNTCSNDKLSGSWLCTCDSCKPNCNYYSSTGLKYSSDILIKYLQVPIES